MGFSGKAIELARQATSLGVLVSSVLIMWKLWTLLSGSDSPVVVVLTGSMEPGFKRGDILFLHLNKSPIRSGDIVVFNVDGRDIPIVHRVVMVHEQRDTGEINFLTKGDNNPYDDRYGGIYANGQLWLQQRDVIGRIIGFLPYVGWATIIMIEKPIIKYLLIGILSLLVISSKE
ncbi:PREDICTED: signal peptidase complex catalytic subunit SEC11C-like [Nelumbo nucifera]|uniref:Signal peptidase complex catalytic subunit SEC11 n=1 Tax=Nelumbo nucifera TaxID=4432 RepID=A0A1U7Z7D9_NELNU|nr:PREDICTED: signal peptidase complex catalytic subunit SEC11C-like [Nelumbo nucifera]